MRLRELFERPAVVEAKPATGRKYQHSEDLIFTGIANKGIAPGSEAGLHAVRILDNMANQDRSLELKWDGAPVVYWGRDDKGRFMLIPKNAWEKLTNGKKTTSTGVSTLIYSDEQLKKFILGTGEGNDAKRKQFAEQLAALWPYFESASPKRGFLEGGLLFYPGKKFDGQEADKIPTEKGTYYFKPNLTGFDIPMDSKLGQRIKLAKVMVAATGYYTSLGSSDEQRLDNVQQLSNQNIIVQGTEYVEKAPGIDSKLLDDARDYISQNANLIDSFLAPKPGLSKVGDILYKFYNQNLRIDGVKSKFKDWAEKNLSANQSAKVLNDPGLDATLTAVEKLNRAKMDVYLKASAMAHGDITQTNPEGFVYYDKETGQYVKAINQKNWAPEKR